MADTARGSALYRQRGMPLINSALWLLCSPSVIFCDRLSKAQTMRVAVRAASLRCLSSPFIFLPVLSTHFSTPHVYGIVIIESCAPLPLRAPYVALSEPLSVSLPLFA